MEYFIRVLSIGHYANTDHATDVSATSTAPLPQPSATSGHGELHELHVAKYTAGHEQKGSHGNIAAGLLGLLFFATFGVFWRKLQRHLQSRHMYYSVSSGLV